MSEPASPAEPFDAAVVDRGDDARDGVGRLLSTMLGTDRIARHTDVRDPSSISERARYLATDQAAAPQLSPRLVDVLRALGDGMTRQRTAQHLGVSEHTVSDYLAAIRTRHLQLGRHVTNTASLLRQAVRDGHLY